MKTDDPSTIPCRGARGTYRVVVETPRGAAFKIRFTPSIGAFELQRRLPAGLVYPFDWGFFPSTRAEDGDPLDAMLLFLADAGITTWPGLVVSVEPLAVLRVVQRQVGARRKKPGPLIRNDRVLAAPILEGAMESEPRLTRALREQLERFFLQAGSRPGKEVRVEGWEGAKAAREAIDRAAALWAESLDGGAP